MLARLASGELDEITAHVDDVTRALGRQRHGRRRPADAPR